MISNRVTLADAIETANTGLDAIRRAPIVEETTGFKCLRIQDVSQKKLFNRWGNTKVLARDFTKFQLNEGDIIIARTGASIGVNLIIQKKCQAVFNNGLIRLRAKKKFLPKFLFYQIQTDEFINHINSIAHSTSTQPNMKIRDLLRFEFKNQSLEDQEKIVMILDQIDSKILLNNQNNKSLEEFAQTIFKSWFVDFDPVHAKKNALEAGFTKDQAECAAIAVISGHSSPTKYAENKNEIENKLKDKLTSIGKEKADELRLTASIFPSEFEHSEIGDIPKGWFSGIVGNICKVKGGYAFKSSDFTDNGLPVIKIKNINNSGRAFVDDVDYISQSVALSAERFRLNDGDLLIAMTGATVGKSGLLILKEKPAYLNQRVGKFEPILDLKVIPFIFTLFSLSETQAYILQTAEGSAQANISSDGIESIKIVIPNENVLNLFCNLTAPFLNQIILNEKENITLSQLRDTLLPKLLAGEINLDNIKIDEQEPK